MKMKFFHIAAILMTAASMLSAQQAGAWGRFDGGVHPAYGGNWAHRNPVIVHNTVINRTGGGCVGCGIAGAAVAGLVGGAIIGAAIAGSAPPPPRTVVVEQAAPVMVAGPPIGSQVAVLPSGCGVMSVNGVQYYQCGSYWYQPFYGGNGVYYTVVPTP
jgi:hypothetical protein